MKASSNRIIDRLFSGAVTRCVETHRRADYFNMNVVIDGNDSVCFVSRGNAVQREGRMSYAEFVWFLLSEEDKKNPTRYYTAAQISVTDHLF